MARSTSHTIYKLRDAAAQSHPDAELLRLMDEHTKAQARVEAAEAALEAKSTRLSEGRFDRLCDKVSDIENAILAQPSLTPEGLRIKARIAARYMQAPADWGGRTYDVFGRFLESVLRQTAADRYAAPVVRGHAAPSRS